MQFSSNSAKSYSSSDAFRALENANDAGSNPGGAFVVHLWVPVVQPNDVHLFLRVRKWKIVFGLNSQ